MIRRIFVALLSLFAVQADAQDTAKAKAECEEIMNALMPLAQQLLEKNGEFFRSGAQ